MLVPDERNVAASLPSVLRGTVRLFARIWPLAKLIVDVGGATILSGPRYTAQELVELTTVRLPVTAVALVGTPPRPQTRKLRGTPFLIRVSRSRAGVRG